MPERPEASKRAKWLFGIGDIEIINPPRPRMLVMIRAEVRCPQCNRKHGANVAYGTPVRCRRCKHEWEVSP